ncbi:tripartite tricarboxylate transporter substrate binding protein [Clostridium sp. chh4-2]|uniref:Bug family tripartite tricarboxylate transporter substrate binding protein n=1 Tax=Clostridium sp. chh4-2 TaxID=2067550 RepID=UPI0015E1A8EF|nr:tripartite tricarboxylate transporter substrate binding protein [Clostridium sp. chh4-2]
MKKKIIAVLLAASMTAGLTACGGGSGADGAAAKTESGTETELQNPTGSSKGESDAVRTETEKKDSEAAGKYPSEKVITWYVQDAGNVTDTIARIIAPKLSEELGQNIVIENAGGAGGMNELMPVLAADADGYSIASLAVAFLCLTPFSSDCTYDYTDFEMLYNVFSQPQVMVVSADAPYSTFEEWKDFVAENPGKFRFGVPGASTVHNMCLQGLKLESGMDYNVINYGNASETVAGLLGKHIEGLVLGYSECMAGIDSGDFKILAFTTDTKYKGYEEIPTLGELGYTSKGVAFQGICLKAGTDPEVTAKLKSAFEKVFNDPEVIEALTNANAWVDGTFQNGEEFTETVKSAYEFYEKVLTETGLMEQIYG